jgi:hypothetical protein
MEEQTHVMETLEEPPLYVTIARNFLSGSKVGEIAEPRRNMGSSLALPHMKDRSGRFWGQLGAVLATIFGNLRMAEVISNTKYIEKG